MEIYGIDLTNLLQALIDVLVLAIGTFATTKFIPWLKARVDKEKLEVAEKIITSTVKAAEQVFSSEQGQEKLAYVKNMVTAELLKKNISIDIDMLTAIIESSVLDLHSKLSKGE